MLACKPGNKTHGRPGAAGEPLAIRDGSGQISCLEMSSIRTITDNTGDIVAKRRPRHLSGPLAGTCRYVRCIKPQARYRYPDKFSYYRGSLVSLAPQIQVRLIYTIDCRLRADRSQCHSLYNDAGHGYRDSTGLARGAEGGPGHRQRLNAAVFLPLRCRSKLGQNLADGNAMISQSFEKGSILSGSSWGTQVTAPEIFTGMDQDEN